MSVDMPIYGWQHSHFDLAPASVALLACYLVYGLLLALYRLYLHPLAHFPGPKSCAVTEWYEFYCYIVKGGQWGNRVQKMHERYGPIVRTSPWELSIRDPEFYSQLYVTASTRRTNMWPRGREGNGFESSHHLSVPHDLHRSRRKHLEPFFSRQGTTRVEHIIKDEAQKLTGRLLRLSGSGTIVHLDHAIAAMTGDIIGFTTCGMQPNLIEEPNFSPSWYELMVKTTTIAPLFRCFTWLNRIIQLLPASVMEGMYPEGISNMMLGKAGRLYIERIKRELDGSPAEKQGQKKWNSAFHHLLSSDIPEEEKSTERLQAESMILLLAGTLAGAHTLTFVLFYLLASPAMEARLRAELESAFALAAAAGTGQEMPSWTELERLPYLTGCIKEALRLNGLVGNLARCSPDKELVYKQWVIPKNVPVGMSIRAMHTDASVFPDPMQFKPERWVGEYDPNMDRNFVPFTKRLAELLAWAEMYVATAALFGPGGPKMTLYETDESDIKIVRDYIMGFPKPGTRGVRVRLG
ncbi:cytochrome P450 family protein [Apiospora aurea]|uniref:Cytochrome P450 family protein n=1 Tax=Apiospora aurea TaxID=335848 RepID=A0ABR1QHC7_9PEZI